MERKDSTYSAIAAAEKRIVFGFDEIGNYLGAVLLAHGVLLYFGSVVLSIETLYSFISLLSCTLACLGALVGLCSKLFLQRFDTIKTDLRTMTWINFSPDDIRTKKTSLSRIREIHDLEATALSLVKTILQVKPFLLLPDDDFSSHESKSFDMSSESGDSDSDTEADEESDAMRTTTTAASYSPHTSPKPAIKLDPMFRIPECGLQPPRIRFDIEGPDTDLSRKAFDFHAPRRDSRRMSLPQGPNRRHSTISGALNAYGRRSSFAPPGGGGRRASVLSEIDLDENDSAAVLKLNHKLRNTMRKRKGTIMSVEFGIFELVNDSTENTYNLAEILVANVLDIVRNNHGCILQIRADGIVASWNTHSPCSMHAWEACRTALEIKESMESVEEDERVGWSVALTGGELYAGHIGNEKNRAHFILGDKVDNAKHMNHLSRVLQTPILLTHSVQEMVMDKVKSRPVDVVEWEGLDGGCKRENVFELLPGDNEVDIVKWKQAFSAFVNERCDDALELLQDMDSDDEQVERMQTLVRCATEKDTNMPRPYARRMEGWQVWNIDMEPSPLATGTGTSIGSYRSMYSADSSSSKKRLDGYKGRCSMVPQEQPAELLKLAIAQEAPDVAYDSEDSDEYDMPPSYFVDKDDCSWRRSDKKLGAGAFGEVWLGMSGEGSLVALKCIKIENQVQTKRTRLGARQSEESPTLQSAINEVKMLSTYKDDSIVCFISCGVYDRFVIVAMEYVSGGSLASVLSDFGGSVPINTAKRYTRDIIKGLMYLHSKNIVHRDLKPANVLLHTDGQCKLADFGTSALSHMVTDSKAIGTPLFMAPEACNGRAVLASDIWSLGHTIVQMLTGYTPFDYTPEIPKQQHNFMRWLAQPTGDVPIPSLSLMKCELAHTLVSKMLTRAHENRPSSYQVSYDPFLL